MILNKTVSSKRQESKVKILDHIPGALFDCDVNKPLMKYTDDIVENVQDNKMSSEADLTLFRRKHLLPIAYFPLKNNNTIVSWLFCNRAPT